MKPAGDAERTAFGLHGSDRSAQLPRHGLVRLVAQFRLLSLRPAIMFPDRAGDAEFLALGGMGVSSKQ